MHGSEPFRSFSQVDQARDPLALANVLRHASGRAWFRALQQHMFALLQVQPGNAVLDIGCGIGQDVLALARLVGPAGRAVGVDSSVMMIEQARAAAAVESPELPVEFLVADALALPFADATFDRCHCERVLQHVADQQRALVEMRRALRPGGRIVLMDADWETVIIDSPDRDMTRAIVRHHADHGVANPWAGRQLRRLAASAGFVDIVAEPMTSAITDFEDATALTRPLAESAVTAGVITQQQADHWLDQLAEAGREGVFWLTGISFVVSARRP